MRREAALAIAFAALAGCGPSESGQGRRLLCFENRGSVRAPADWVNGDGLPTASLPPRSRQFTLLSGPRVAGTKGVIYAEGQALIHVLQVSVYEQGGQRPLEESIDFLLEPGARKQRLGRRGGCLNAVKAEEEWEEGRAFSESTLYACDASGLRVFLSETHWKGDPKAEAYRAALAKMLRSVRGEGERGCR